MSGTDVKTLMIQVDASVELLRRNLAAAEGSLGQFENRANQTDERVNRAFARMGQGTTASAGQMKAGMQQLSFQLNDVATQFASGTKPMVIFAQQGSQVLQAVQMMAGESKGFIGFMAGPWGMAITAASVALTPFISKLFDTGDAAKSATDKVYDLKAAIADLKSKPMEALGNLQSSVFLAEGRLAAARAMPRYTGGGSEAYKRGTAVEQARSRAIADAEMALRQARSDLAVAQFTANSIKATSGDERTGRSHGPRGPSAETLAHRAEAARVKMLGEENAYTSAERQARHALLDATRKTAASEEQRDALLRDDINAEAAASKTKIANDLSAHKITDEQAATLTDLAEQTRQQKLLNVDLQRRADTIREAAAVEAQGYDNQISLLQLQEGMATTVQQRRDIQRQLLDLETKRLLAEQQAIIDNPLSTTNQVLDAIGRQQQVRKEQPLKQAGIDRANPMPMEEYARKLKTNTESMTEAMQRVQADGLGALENGLVDAITGTKSLGDAFGSMADQIIADLARIAVEKMLVGMIGNIFGGSGGILGSLLGFSEGGPVRAMATGGFITGPGTGTSDSIMARLSNGEYVMRAEAVRRIGVPALDMLNTGRMARFAAGGLVAPRVPRMVAANANGAGAGVSMPITINAPGATAETVAMIRRELANAAPMIAAASTAQTTRVMNRRRL